MIRSLYIKNFALIEELEVDFEQGLNILTGQTGAGKSIILGALNMILGERADTQIVRQGTKKAVAEAVIKTGKNEAVEKILQENAVELNESLILRREIRESGSRAFINDTPVTITVLKKVGNYLVDLHGQHDHQMLLNEDNHRGVIDSFGNIEVYLEAYREQYHKMESLQRELKDLKRRENELQEKLELYRFQKEELEGANLEAGEVQKLQAEINLLGHAEDLAEKSESVLALSSSEEGVLGKLNTIKLHLEDMSRIEPEFESYLEEIGEARISVQEMGNFIEQYQRNIEFNPRRLEKLRRRQNELNGLRKKYNRSLPELIEYLKGIKQELKLAENFDIEIEKIKDTIEEHSAELKKSAIKLHQKREKAGKALSQSVIGELSHLGIEHAQFEVHVDWISSGNGWFEIENQQVVCGEHGCDELQLFISTNKGETPKPLAKVASGGEVSRVMLALKSTLAKQENLPIMIFDEIDSGISGEVSEKVGRTMRRLSQRCQIIAITHQPQIASQAHKHYKVEKAEQADRTVTRINPLSDRQHIQEIASLMSGEDITEAGLKNAEELVEKNTFQN